MRFRLRELPASLRLAITCFVMTIGAGYMFALLNVYIHYAKADGEPGLTAKDIIRTFYGPDDKQSLLEAKIKTGSMKDFVPDELSRGQLVSWVRDGASKELYDTKIGKIFNENCTGCHGPGGLMSAVPLAPYDQIPKFILKMDRGKPLNALVQSSHTHLISLSMMFFLLAALFCCTGAPNWLKGAAAPLPFLGIMLDVGGWWLTKYQPIFAYPMMWGGALMGSAFAVFAFGILGECWFSKR
jgi:hypothetical protein